MALDYMPRLLALKAALNTPSLPAVLNRQKLNPPCVFIALRGLDVWTLCADSAEAGVHVWVCVGDKADEAALTELSPLLSGLLERMAAEGLPIELVATDQIRGTDTSTAFPAFRIETHLTV